MAGDYRITFAAEQVAKKNVAWLQKLIRVNSCEECLDEMDVDWENGAMFIPAHCGKKINDLWRIVCWSREPNLSPNSLLSYYDEEDFS